MAVIEHSWTVVVLALPGAATPHLAVYFPLSWLSDLFFWLFMAFLGLIYILVYVVMAVIAWLLLMGVLAVICWPLGWLYERLTEEPAKPAHVNPYGQIDRLTHDYVDAAARLLGRR